ncbi:hypothetical protein F4803DRAFT_554195 [Xylaria telfairii]|nr:hypothetical protein F4803DRAFT_554195 [Xylaria telfairii]
MVIQCDALGVDKAFATPASHDQARRYPPSNVDDASLPTIRGNSTVGSRAAALRDSEEYGRRDHVVLPLLLGLLSGILRWRARACTAYFSCMSPMQAPRTIQLQTANCELQTANPGNRNVWILRSANKRSVSYTMRPSRRRLIASGCHRARARTRHSSGRWGYCYYLECKYRQGCGRGVPAMAGRCDRVAATESSKRRKPMDVTLRAIMHRRARIQRDTTVGFEKQ